MSREFVVWKVQALTKLNKARMLTNDQNLSFKLEELIYRIVNLNVLDLWRWLRDLRILLDNVKEKDVRTILKLLFPTDEEITHWFREYVEG